MTRPSLAARTSWRRAGTVGVNREFETESFRWFLWDDFCVPDVFVETFWTQNDYDFDDARASRVHVMPTRPVSTVQPSSAGLRSERGFSRLWSGLCHFLSLIEGAGGTNVTRTVPVFLNSAG
jgi:hypothetical protein